MEKLKKKTEAVLRSRSCVAAATRQWSFLLERSRAATMVFLAGALAGSDSGPSCWSARGLLQSWAAAFVGAATSPAFVGCCSLCVTVE
ncbi:hypothetical protein SESBI_44593 [Sesbania bispinosa]|nr:hypothetical protein SESBI_44593 [Sesbania bispinosa]